MRKSISDILCGASFLAISAAFGLQYEGLTGVSRVFPESLILIIAVGGLWFVGKGLYKQQYGAIHILLLPAAGRQKPESGTPCRCRTAVQPFLQSGRLVQLYQAAQCTDARRLFILNLTWNSCYAPYCEIRKRQPCF